MSTDLFAAPRETSSGPERPLQSPLWQAMTTEADLRSAPREAYASWGRRVAATLVDAVVVLWLTSAPVLALVALTIPLSEGLALAIGVLGYVLVVVFAVDQLVKQGKRGATIGKWLLGLRLVDGRTGQPVGVLRSVIRPFAHIIDGLPLYSGYFAPLVTARKQTFTDMAQNTVVLRVPAPRRDAVQATALLAVSALVMVAASIYAVSQAAEDRLTDEVAAVPADPAAPAAQEPAAGTVLAPEDIEGRIAVPPGFEVVPDDETGLGMLDARGTAELGGGPPEQVEQTVEAFTELGLQEAFARVYVSDDLALRVVAYRFGSSEEATRFVEVVADANASRPTPVPDAVAYDSGGDVITPTGLFARGPFAYELSVDRPGGQTTDDDLTPLLQGQYDAAARNDP